MKQYAKAVVSGVVTLAAYLVAVVPAEGGFGDVSLAQWLGAVVFLGAAYGITAAVPNAQPDVLVRVDDHGNYVAGDATPHYATGAAVDPYATVKSLTHGPVDA